MKRQFMVNIDVPKGVTIKDVRQYIFDAVSSYCGALQPPGYGPGGPDENEPGDPLWGIGNNVTVKSIANRRQ